MTASASDDDHRASRSRRASSGSAGVAGNVFANAQHSRSRADAPVCSDPLIAPLEINHRAHREHRAEKATDVVTQSTQRSRRILGFLSAASALIVALHRILKSVLLGDLG